MDWLKILKDWQVPVLITLGGLVFVFLSFFDGLPTPNNGWATILRPEVNQGLLAVALVLIVSGTAISTINSFKPQNLEKPGKAIKINPEENTDTARDEKSDTLPKKSYKGDLDNHPIVKKWWKLSSTQKEIVVFLYEHSHRDQISFDQLYEAFCKKYSKQPVPNSDEMYFRIRTLEAEGFLRLLSIAEKATDIERIPEVTEALERGDIIATRG